MNARTSEDTRLGFISDLPDLGAISLEAMRRLDGTALHAVLDRVVRQTGTSIKSITSCSSVNRIG